MAIQPGTTPGSATGYEEVNKISRGRFRDPYLREFEPVRIFNVGQWGVGGASFIRVFTCGSHWMIPLRKDGEVVSAPLEVPDPYIEYYAKGLGSTEGENTISGMRLAQEIIGQSSGEDLSPGVSAGKSYETDLRRWGVFIAKGPVPTKEEIAEATRRYHETLKALCAEAKQLFGMNEKKWIQPMHYFAGRVLRIKDDWNKDVMDSAQPETQACPACGEQIKIGVAKCGKCQAILDVEKAKQFGLITDQQLEAMTAPGSGKKK